MPFFPLRLRYIYHEMSADPMRALEAESIAILREAIACFERPVLLYSIGKDSTVLLHLLRKAVYPGPIGSILTPQVEGAGLRHELPDASSLCGACAEVCPVQIPITHLLIRLRREASHGPAGSAVLGAGGVGGSSGSGVSNSYSTPKRAHLARKLAMSLSWRW